MGKYHITAREIGRIEMHQVHQGASGTSQQGLLHKALFIPDMLTPVNHCAKCEAVGYDERKE